MKMSLASDSIKSPKGVKNSIISLEGKLFMSPHAMRTIN